MPAEVRGELRHAEKKGKLAIQVAARLNVEMRRGGKRGLNSDVITHLARILEEALAQAASNSENKPS